MSRISFTGDALRELQERMAQSKRALGVSIAGPFDYDIRAADNAEEAWAVQKLYGPAQRWVLNLLPLEIFGDTVAQGFHLEEIGGIPVRILAREPMPRLRVELHGDAIRVYEIVDAQPLAQADASPAALTRRPLGAA